jgi:hypothetical protein
MMTGRWRDRRVGGICFLCIFALMLVGRVFEDGGCTLVVRRR